ncbi:hypothetical protein PTKIN_Ptkin16aG0011600 [Pterospermum kingtungense]
MSMKVVFFVHRQMKIGIIFSFLVLVMLNFGRSYCNFVVYTGKPGIGTANSIGPLGRSKERLFFPS